MEEKVNPLHMLEGRKLSEHTLHSGDVKKGGFVGAFMFSLLIEEKDTVGGLYYRE